jgi:hypothetical protein
LDHPFVSFIYCVSLTKKRKKKAIYIHMVRPQGAGRALHEYQFLPEQPTVRSDAYERVAPSYHYGAPADGPNSRTSSLSSGRSFMHGNEQVPSGYGFQGQVPGLNLLPQQGMQAHLLPSVSVENDTVARKNTLANIRDAHFGAHPITRMENPFISPDRRVTLEEDVSRMERKRKVSHTMNHFILFN